MTAIVPRPGEPAPAATAMRGREREWDTVLDLLKAAEAGRPGVLLVEGEHGTGKSVLLEEAARTAAASVAVDPKNRDDQPFPPSYQHTYPDLRGTYAQDQIGRSTPPWRTPAGRGAVRPYQARTAGELAFGPTVTCSGRRRRRTLRP